MTRGDKLDEKLRRFPPLAAWEDVRRFLEAHGWTLAHRKGSHVTFQKAGERTLTFPLKQGRWVKRVYVRQIVLQIDQE